MDPQPMVWGKEIFKTKTGKTDSVPVLILKYIDKNAEYMDKLKSMAKSTLACGVTICKQWYCRIRLLECGNVTSTHHQNSLQFRVECTHQNHQSSVYPNYNYHLP